MVEKFWFERALDFLKIAEEMKEKGYYWYVCFNSQQAVEFLLKGLQVKYAGKHSFTHDLSSLLTDVEKMFNKNAPQEIYLACDFLTPHYARYSQITEYDRRKAEECINQAKKVFSWINDNVEKLFVN